MASPEKGSTPTKALGDAFDAEGASRALQRVLERAYRAVLGDVVPLAEAVLGVPADPDAPTTAQYLADAGRLIGSISETTRRAIVDALQESVRLGEGVSETAARVDALGIWDRSRAETISRTEIGTCSNLASIASFTTSGVVAGVLIHDGDGCGLRGHDDPQKADGMRLPLDALADVPALSHPRCVRAYGPITDAGELDGAA